VNDISECGERYFVSPSGTIHPRKTFTPLPVVDQLIAAQVIAAETLQMNSMISPIKAAKMKAEGNFSFAQMRIAKRYGIFRLHSKKFQKLKRGRSSLFLLFIEHLLLKIILS